MCLKLDRKTFLAAAVGLLLAVMSTASLAQPDPGDRVRLKTHGSSSWKTGIWAAPDESSFQITPQGTPDTPLLFDASDVERLQVSRGKKGNIGRGLLYGGLTGMFIGVVSIASEESEPGEWDIISDEFIIAVTTLTFAAAGGLIGLIVRTEKWETVGAPVVALFPQPRGGGIVVTVNW